MQNIFKNKIFQSCRAVCFIVAVTFFIANLATCFKYRDLSDLLEGFSYMLFSPLFFSFGIQDCLEAWVIYKKRQNGSLLEAVTSAIILLLLSVLFLFASFEFLK